MTSPLQLLLVGCGMMGARHLRGIAELERVAPGAVRLVGLCDVREDLARKVATEAEELLGARPGVFTDLEAALKALPDLQAADLVTDPRSHDGLAVALMEAGLHVICEKPLACTMARGRRMVEFAQRTGRVLATAENNKRDPMARLARAAITGGLIGRPNTALQVSIGPGSGIVATAWRHRLAMGGVLLDVAIHLGYMLEYLIGPVETVHACAQIVQRRRAGREYDGNEVEVTVDAPDACTAMLQFTGGVQASWISHFAGTGEGLFKRLIIGDAGTLDFPSERSGQSPSVQRGSEHLAGQDLVNALPEYCLSDIESRLFGERCAGYSLEYPVTDRRLIAAELADFAEAIQIGRSPESDGLMGLRAVAIILAMLESSLARRPVTLDEILSGALHAYQDTIEAAG